jgi:tetratricopeptide (TPR) repeat protein
MAAKRTVLIWGVGIVVVALISVIALYKRNHEPDRLGLAYLAGTQAEKRGDLSDAASKYEQTTMLDPKFCSGYFNLGAVYERQSRIPEAIASFERALTCFRSGSVHSFMGMYSESARKLDVERTMKRIEGLKAASAQPQS